MEAPPLFWVAYVLGEIGELCGLLLCADVARARITPIDANLCRLWIATRIGHIFFQHFFCVIQILFPRHVISPVDDGNRVNKQNKASE